MKNRNFLIQLLLFVFCASVFLSFWPESKTPYKAETQVKSSEIEAIVLEKDVKKQTEYYTQLIERVGPEAAQEELYLSGLPFDGQVHLLNHRAGEWLYEKYGNKGLPYCRDYFLSSCYHGFVIRAIGEGGLDSLAEVMATCWAEGPTTATQCAHAIGHGILANMGYEFLPEALGSCDQVAQNSPNFPLYSCYDGTFMENIWAIHEGGVSPKQWVSATDHIYPCNSWKIAEKYRQACWSNQPPRMYMMFGGDVKKIGEVCLSLTNSAYQTTCFDALARQIHPLIQGNTEKVFEMCSKMPTQKWINSCVASIAKASFSVGDRVGPYDICQKTEGDAREECFSNLIGIIKAYAESNPQAQNEWCSKISDPDYSSRCKAY